MKSTWRQHMQASEEGGVCWLPLLLEKLLGLLMRFGLPGERNLWLMLLQRQAVLLGSWWGVRRWGGHGQAGLAGVGGGQFDPAHRMKVWTDCWSGSVHHPRDCKSGLRQDRLKINHALHCHTRGCTVMVYCVATLTERVSVWVSESVGGWQVGVQYQDN